MRLKIALDASFVIGLIDDEDRWHNRARGLQAAIVARNSQCYIFDSVLAEVISTLARRIRDKRRETELPALLAQIRAQFPARSITWLYPDLPALYDDVLDLVQQSAGKLNFNDALIALSCRHRGIAYLASFDADFDLVVWLKRLGRVTDIPAKSEAIKPRNT